MGGASLFDLPLVGARWLHFVALATVFGAALFHPLVAPRKRDAPTPSPPPGAWIVAAAWLALASGLGWIAASLLAMTDNAASLLDPGTVAAFFSDTGFGHVWMARLILLGALAVLATWPGRRTRWGRLALLAGGALATQAWLGHAASGTGTEGAAELASYMAHVLAASAWVGGLAPLGLALAQGGIDARARRAMLLRFSNLGMAAVAVILASGIANGLFRLASPRDLVSGVYGRTLLVKVALFLAMLCVAAANRWRLMPRLARGETGALAALQRNIGIELALGTAVLGAAALLGTLPPQG